MRSLFLSLILLILPFVANAQGLGGYVVDRLGNAIEGATVVEISTLRGSVTDDHGHFLMRYEGSFPTRIVVRCLGYNPDTLVVNHRSRDIRIILNTNEVAAGQVDVVAQRKTDLSFESIDAHVAAQIASADGGIEAVIKSQMGVSSNSELSSQYRVRGGNFDENIVYVNGVEIYRPFLIRSGEQEGLSFVNPDMVSELNFSAGGFDASYGDKMASVLDVKYKVPDTTHFGVRLSLLGASAHAEGALLDNKLTHITGVRYKTNQYLFGSLDTQGDYAPTFFDAQTYWTLRPSPRTTIGLLAYYAQNRYNFDPKDRETEFGTISDAKQLTIYFEGRERDRYQTCVVAANVQQQVGDALKLGLTASMFRSEEQEYYDILGEYWLQQAAASQDVNSVDQTQNIGVGGYMQHARNNLFGQVYSGALNAQLRLTGVTLRAQARVTREIYSDYTDEWQYTDSAGYVSAPGSDIVLTNRCYALSDLRFTRPEFYLVSNTDPIPAGRGSLQLTTGLRFAHSSLSGKNIYSPRLAIHFNLFPWRFRLATGRYSQLPNIREMKRSDGSLNTALGPQKSWQLIGGADFFFGSDDKKFKLTIEAYYKWLRHLNPYNIDNVRLRYLASDCAEGYAAGLDVKLNGELVPGLDSWVSISLMKTAEDIENDGHGYIPRPSDQRFQFSALLQDCMPNNQSITAMLSLFFGSGLPFGPQDCERWQATHRMPGYKRVDLGLAKDFAIDARGQQKISRLRMAKLGIEIFNLFDIANTVSYFWVSDTDNRSYGVPNYLTSRRVNAKFTLEF